MSALRRLVPHVQIQRYDIDGQLRAILPDGLDGRDALLLIDYFGYLQPRPGPETRASVLEDCSHRSPERDLWRQPGLRFGSLRKVFPVADGGWLAGEFAPEYEARDLEYQRLRSRATTWAQCRAAEDLLDRAAGISDISGDSLAVVLSADWEQMQAQRRANESQLRDSMRVGTPLRSYRADEVPLGHVRVFESRGERDALRTALAEAHIFAAVLWEPGTDPSLAGAHLERARDWSDRHLVMPVGPHLDGAAMERIAEVANGC